MISEVRYWKMVY